MCTFYDEDLNKFNLGTQLDSFLIMMMKGIIQDESPTHLDIVKTVQKIIL